MVITWEEALAARAAEGKILGRLETLRETIQLLLQRRFGRRAETLEDRLLAIDDPKRLDELLKKAIDARSLDELGLAG